MGSIGVSERRRRRRRRRHAREKERERERDRKKRENKKTPLFDTHSIYSSSRQCTCLFTRRPPLWWANAACNNILFCMYVWGMA
jgi:predicted acetyltransferase